MLIRNLNSRVKVNLRLVERLACNLLKKEFGKKNARIEITFVDDNAIRKINSKFRHVDEPTDVLSFSYGNGRGEIIISSERAAENAPRYGNTLKKELTLYVIHGILHYLGFDDEKKRSRRIMQKREEKLAARYAETAEFYR